MDILQKTRETGYSFSREEIIRLLQIENQSKAFYDLLAASSEQSHRKFVHNGMEKEQMLEQFSQGKQFLS